MSNSLVAIPAGWPGPAAPRCRPTVFYRPGLWPGPGAHWQRPLARTAILMCHGLATELHLNLQVPYAKIMGCAKFGAVRAASRKNQLRRGATAALRENPVLAC